MLKKLLLAGLLALVCITGFANGNYIDPFAVYVFSEGLCGYYDSVSGLFGYIDKKGKAAIEPQFLMAGRFKSGRALVQTEEYRFAFIEASGRIVIGPSDTMHSDFTDSLAFTWDDDGVKFIDKNGKTVLKAKYADARGFHNGLACVFELDNEGIGKWGYIDKKGKMVIKAQFEDAGDFSDTGDGLAKIGVSDEKSSYGFSYGYIDKKGKIAIKPRFALASEFSEGLAFGLDSQMGQFGYFDKTGRWVIKPQFKAGVGDFSEGLAAVGILNEDGETQKVGFIDKKGKFVIQPVYSQANRFSEGLAAVIIDGKVGFIDKKGKFVIQPQFDAMFNGYEGF